MEVFKELRGLVPLTKEFWQPKPEQQNNFPAGPQHKRIIWYPIVFLKHLVCCKGFRILHMAIGKVWERYINLGHFHGLVHRPIKLIIGGTGLSFCLKKDPL